LPCTEINLRQYSFSKKVRVIKKEKLACTWKNAQCQFVLLTISIK